MSRYKFNTGQAHITVNPQGYFEVFASSDCPTHERPDYRGELAEFGHGVFDGSRLTMRPDSARMAAVVTAWSALHGADAVAGKLGLGRQGAAPLTLAEQKAADDKIAAKKADRAEQATEAKRAAKKGDKKS